MMIQSFEKTKIRYLIREQLNAMDFSIIETKSQKVFQKLLEVKELKKAWTVFVYISLKDEVQTFNSINHLIKEWKKVIVPKVVNNHMEMVVYKNKWKLIHWKYWIYEPKDNDIYRGKVDLAIIPWLAFTLTWKRLWKWGWYYDNFLSNNPETYKIWICFWFQILYDEKVPTEKHDVRMDQIVYD